jgi:transcriptional regulator with XRE-family HTH domain
MPLEDLGRLVLERRGGRGVRAVAKEIGISHATLSRVERGFLPDLENYEKICRWLGFDANAVHARAPKSVPTPHVHFRREKTATAETAAALAQMILAAQAAWPKRDK